MKKLVFFLITIFALTACSNNKINDEANMNSNENVKWVMIPMIVINDKLYLYSGEKKVYDELTDFDGEIDSAVEDTSKPTKNNQSNFGTGFKYKILDEGKVINLYLNDDNRMIIFKTEEDRN
ncbi:membrane lipoprotein lipid attachment site-containing protein [Anaerococcus sp. Marseille-P3915]|uniref:membrane lipoprotein lipid attachment site-containing protein n=1 Tax=Anaerococcus sp. Marseille-P3915 TaxID=2057799 RepID=UPI000D0AE1DD|nr:membrane lipoprotein lipid attachment site-containing protein [Anaerococcus sp. Marseille-P3915]